MALESPVGSVRKVVAESLMALTSDPAWLVPNVLKPCGVVQGGERVSSIQLLSKKRMLHNLHK